MRVAHSVTLDARDGSLSIEGVKLPYYLRSFDGVQDHEGVVGSVTVTLYADNIEVVSKSGEVSRPHTAPLEGELEWARREAGDVVRAGMADVLEWLWKGAVLGQLGKDVLRLDEETRKALASETTHSEE